MSKENLLEEVKNLNGGSPEKMMCNADTILADIVAEYKFDKTGHALEIFDAWKNCADKDAVERMFKVFTGMDFEEYLQRCRDILSEQQRCRDKGFYESLPRISEILESHMWHFVSDEPKRQRNRFWSIDIITVPPSGNNLTRTVWFDGTVDSFIESIRELADDFDPDEHTASCIPLRGLDGIPTEIRSILNDADAVKRRLTGLADDLESWNESRLS